MKSHNSVIGRNSRQNEYAHDRHDERKWVNIRDYQYYLAHNDQKSASRVLKRLHRFYPEAFDTNGEVVN